MLNIKKIVCLVRTVHNLFTYGHRTSGTFSAYRQSKMFSFLSSDVQLAFCIFR